MLSGESASRELPMAYGSELFLGVLGIKNVTEAWKSVGVTWAPFDDIERDEIDKALKNAHAAALQELGMELIDKSRIQRSDGKPVKTDPHYVYVQGTDGVLRETIPWRLELSYDPGEMGHEPEDVMLGVSLVSRYFPTFLDWDKESGGSGDTIALTPTILSQIEIARKYITPIVPFIKDAPIIFRPMHY
jgi:hypothetical protein